MQRVKRLRYHRGSGWTAAFDFAFYWSSRFLCKKDKAKRWNNNLAFSKRYLHLNLLKKFTDEEDSLDLEYDFYFLTEREAKDDKESNPEEYFWFKR